MTDRLRVDHQDAAGRAILDPHRVGPVVEQTPMSFDGGGELVQPAIALGEQYGQEHARHNQQRQKPPQRIDALVDADGSENTSLQGEAQSGRHGANGGDDRGHRHSKAHDRPDEEYQRHRHERQTYIGCAQHEHACHPPKQCNTQAARLGAPAPQRAQERRGRDQQRYEQNDTGDTVRPPTPQSGQKCPGHDRSCARRVCDQGNCPRVECAGLLPLVGHQADEVERLNHAGADDRSPKQQQRVLPVVEGAAESPTRQQPEDDRRRQRRVRAVVNAIGPRLIQQYSRAHQRPQENSGPEAHAAQNQAAYAQSYQKRGYRQPRAGHVESRIDDSGKQNGDGKAREAPNREQRAPPDVGGHRLLICSRSRIVPGVWPAKLVCGFVLHQLRRLAASDLFLLWALCVDERAAVRFGEHRDCRPDGRCSQPNRPHSKAVRGRQCALHTHAVIVDIHLDGLRRDDDAHADVRRVRVPQRIGDSLLHDAVQMFAALERKAERRLRLDPNLRDAVRNREAPYWEGDAAPPEGRHSRPEGAKRPESTVGTSSPPGCCCRRGSR